MTKTNLGDNGYYSVIFGRTISSRTTAFILWESQSWNNSSCWSSLFNEI